MHGAPPAGTECLVSFEEIDASNYVEYKTLPSGKWSPCLFCEPIVQHLLNTQFETYLQTIEKASKDCAAAVRRVVIKGPPIYVSDPQGFPLPEGDTHVEELWFSSSQKTVSAKLKDAKEGEAREALWQAQRDALAAMEAAEKAEASAAS